MDRWVSDFLTARQQTVTLGPNDDSEWSEFPAGVTLGTIPGPWLYAFMINGLDVSGVSLWKYVDDITVSEIELKNMASNIQSIVDDIQSQSESLKFILNKDKRQEMRIQFSKVQSQCLPLTICSKEPALVNQAKVLGVIIRNDLKWNSHVDSIVRKASKTMYFLRQLKRANVSCNDLVQFYCMCIRPVVEYASPVFHYALPASLNDELD